jgi:hypothetical protein
MSKRGLFVLPVVMFILASCITIEVEDNTMTPSLTEGIITLATDQPQIILPSFTPTPEPIIPTPTFTPSPLPLPTNTPLATSTNTYVSVEGRFSINVPLHFSLYVAQVPSVDGVLVAMPNAIALQSQISPPMLVTIRYFEIDEATTLADFFADQDPCSAGVPGRDYDTIDGIETILVPDAPCGPYGYSTYALVRSGYGYLIQVEHFGAFEEVKEILQPLLETFHTLE